jgi:hypothetical protein
LLRPSWRRTVLDAQLVVIVTYTVLATIALPALWADPFGSLLKNFAVLAASLLCAASMIGRELPAAALGSYPERDSVVRHRAWDRLSWLDGAA